MDIQITDEHLEKLEIEKDSVLLVRMPQEMSNAALSEACQSTRKYIQERIGRDVPLIAIPNDVEISTLDAEALNSLKTEINLIILRKRKGEGS